MRSMRAGSFGNTNKLFHPVEQFTPPQSQDPTQHILLLRKGVIKATIQRAAGARAGNFSNAYKLFHPMEQFSSNCSVQWDSSNCSTLWNS